MPTISWTFSLRQFGEVATSLCLSRFAAHCTGVHYLLKLSKVGFSLRRAARRWPCTLPPSTPSESLRSPRVYRLSITGSKGTTAWQRNEMEINADNVGQTDVKINIYENRRAEAISVLILMHKTMAPWLVTHARTMFVPRFRRFRTAAEIAYWYEEEEAGDVVTTRYQAGLRRFQSESPLYRRYDDVYKTIHDHSWNNEYACWTSSRLCVLRGDQLRDIRRSKPLVYRTIEPYFAIVQKSGLLHDLLWTMFEEIYTEEKK